MRIDCTIDGKEYTLSVNSDKPLLQILVEDFENDSMKSSCKGAYCGNCIVMLNNNAVLACLVPAFRLKDAVVETYDSFRKTKDFRIINKAYQTVGCMPCRQCFPSKTLIIQSVILTLERRQKQIDSVQNFSSAKHFANSINTQMELDSFVRNELSLNSCPCTEIGELAKVVKYCFDYRRKHNV